MVLHIVALILLFSGLLPTVWAPLPAKYRIASHLVQGKLMPVHY